ncbi:helix-turn-helix transcriptional regulator [Turicimonas muris]|uniref:helix-turn-helix transcriptional regulator n=1 Tax=Turicimonas muris TaxID=1796652 RepID=UPI0023EF60A7|nr:helix-turn-helix domain-containing protein [Turicimonas muris]
MRGGKLLTRKEVAELCQVSLGTLHNWINGGYVSGGKFIEFNNGFPKPKKLGKLVRFDENEIVKWLSGKTAA